MAEAEQDRECAQLDIRIHSASARASRRTEMRINNLGGGCLFARAVTLFT